MPRDNELFKLISVRPPRSVDDATTVLVPPLRRDRPTRLQRAVAPLDGQPDAPARARSYALEFIASDRYSVRADAGRAFLMHVMRTDRVLQQLPAIVDRAQVADVIEREFGEPPSRLVRGETFTAVEEDLWDSVYANAMVPGERPTDRELLFQAVRVARLIEILAEPPGADQLLPVQRLRAAEPLLPRELFPQVHAGELTPDDPGAPPAVGLLDARSRLQAARAELERLYRRNRSDVLSALSAQADGHAPVRAKGPGAMSLDGERPVLRGPKPPPVRQMPLWRFADEQLGEATRRVLADLGVSPDVDSAPEAIDRLSAEVGRVNAELLPLVGTRSVRLLGASRIYQREPQAQYFSVLAPRAGGALLPTGPFRPPAIPVPAAEPYRVLGIGDLIVARETLLRYETGEVAHIENVLSGEMKSRVHRRKRQLEEVQVVETERVERQERELETTDRFELQKESQRVVDTEVSLGAGVSVSANYGYVSVTATGNFAYNSSRSESTAAASTYARSVTDRAVSRIEERVREERIRRTLEEFEETNTHTLDASARDHVRGIYQWLDKVTSVQLVNYGERLMLEFVVPEPAAFFIFAQRNTSMPGVAGEEPIPPEDLGLASHRVITADNFPVFVAAYRVEDIEPPPAERAVLAKAYEQPSVDQPQIFAKSDLELKVPDGYRAGIAVISYAAFGNVGSTSGGYIQVGNNWIDAGSAALGGAIHRTLNYETGTVPVSVLTNDPGYILNVEIECELTAAERESWQLKTYAAIVAAYRARKAEYDEQVARARIRQGIEITGKNPLLNRKTEREELKKSCITLLTGRRFEDFSGIDINAAPWYAGYPEIANGTVAQHADRIQFLEQAFEWEQMTYALYPYFWGRKQSWLDIFPLDDIDPKFAEFLRAGAARVVVPVPLTYAGAVLYFVATGAPWTGGPAPTLDDPLFRSIAAELRRQQGGDFVEREGTVNVRSGSRDVVGVGTAFVDDDHDRQVSIRGSVYRIGEVQSPTSLRLTQAYAGDDEDDVPYAIGATLVGQPWTVRVPTSLVYLNEAGTLPVFDSGP